MKNELDKNFLFASYDTVKLAKKYATPLYVLSREIIRDRCRDIREEFLNKYSNTKAVYAGKAFLTMAMCKIIEEEGLGLDVVSGGELYTAIKANFPMERIILHGNNKSYDEIEMAVKNSVGRIVIDNIEEISVINNIAKKMDKTMKVLLRVIPGVSGDTHKYISTGQKDSKFGIALDNIYEAVVKAMESENIEFCGFHFHIGSNLHSNDPYIKAVKKVLQVIKDLKNDLAYSIKELNVGGGFGRKDIGYYTKSIMETLYEYCKVFTLDIPTIIIEPGRWIVESAGITLYTVGTVKKIPGIRTYAAIDGGLPDNPRPALYGANYKAVIANKYHEEADYKTTIAGKCCESGDILIWDLETPYIERGDILAVLNTGAYNYSMSSNYNRIPRPAIILLTNEGERLILKRESYEDITRNDIIL